MRRAEEGKREPRVWSATHASLADEWHFLANASGQLRANLYVSSSNINETRQLEPRLAPVEAETAVVTTQAVGDEMEEIRNPLDVELVPPVF